MNRKTLKLVVGTACNQHCSCCHAIRTEDIPFTENMFSYIQYNDFTHISYGSGEPLLYWDTILKFVKRFPKLRHSFTTNGSLLTQDIINDIIKYNIHVSLSFNGYDVSSRTYNLDYNLLKQLPELGISLLYTGEKTLDELDQDLDILSKHLGYPKTAYYNVMHPTETMKYTEKQIHNYLRDMILRMFNAIQDCKSNKITRHTVLLQQLLTPHTWGCFNENYRIVSLDGRSMICPYTDTYSNIPIIKKPTECSSCPANGFCRACYLAPEECHIYHTLYRFISEYTTHHNIKIQDIINSINHINFYSKKECVLWDSQYRSTEQIQ
jgi:MoaA/NifB/PqqE/SkfB family radical SAM enzyme